ncbi:hypothetical protein [Winogradskyella sp.]|jgi:hypothetical protein|uniref:hypothetical protein n=1 Tax=Winogradskyella sp. TaxID=1883156 RepID=UPI0025F51887|nr:hypothetical protein [Winogradskyella sp.]MCT4628812.1 hypothetical protein [Winogradskyella sp.]
MSKLHIDYSKKIVSQIGKAAVVLPGSSVQVGDILQFPEGKSFFKTAPFGSFKKITDLSGLKVNYDVFDDDNSPDTYEFKSNDSLDFDFELNGKGDPGSDILPKAEAKVKISFSKEGAIFFQAIECTTQSLNNIHELENTVMNNESKFVWKDTYLVTSVTTAKKALVAFSNSKKSELVLGGDVENLNSRNASQLSLNTKLKREKLSGNVLFKDWSDDVTIFMDVIRFKKKDFAREKDMSFDSNPAIEENFNEERIELKALDLKSFLNEENQL